MKFFKTFLQIPSPKYQYRRLRQDPFTVGNPWLIILLLIKIITYHSSSVCITFIIRCYLINSYGQQIASARFENENTEDVSTQRRVRHSYLMSAILIYSEYIFREEALEDVERLESSKFT